MGRRTALEIAFQPLSPRECELIRRFAATGAANKELGYQMKITTGTVKQYFTRIMRKIQVNSRAEVLVWYLGKDVK